MNEGPGPTARSHGAVDAPAEALTYVLDPSVYLAHRQASVRLDAVELLRWLGRPGDLDCFVRAALDPDPEVRAAGARALARTRSDAGHERLRRIAGATGPEAERAAEAPAVMESIGVATPIEPRPAPSAKDAPRVARLLRLLGHVGTFEALETIRPYAASEASELREAAAEGLGRLGFESALPTLAELSRDPERGVREAAAAALARIGSGGHTDAATTDPVSAERGRAAHLRVATGPLEGRVFPLQEPVTVLGRARDARIRLPDPWLSRHHAEVSLRGGAYWIRDLASTNGTFLNGCDTEEHILSNGAHIVTGESVLIFWTEDR